MSRIITPSPAAELRAEQEGQDQRHRHARGGQRDEQQRDREDDAAERVGRPEPDPPADPGRHQRPDDRRSRRCRAPGRGRPATRPSSVVTYRMNSALDAKVKKLIVATDSSVGRMIESPTTNVSPARSRSRVEPSSASIGGSGERIRRRKTTDPRNDRASATIAIGAPSTWTSRPPIGRPADRRQRPAAVEQGHRLDVAVALRRPPRTACSTTGRTRPPASRPGTRRRTAAASPGRPRSERDRDARDERGPAEIGRDHQPAPAADAVQPDAGRQREQQVREQAHRREQAHLGRIRAQCQDGDERQPELGDLIAEDRDRLAEPEPAEVGGVEKQRRDEPAKVTQAHPGLGGPRRDGRAGPISPACSAAGRAASGPLRRSRSGDSAERA